MYWRVFNEFKRNVNDNKLIIKYLSFGVWCIFVLLLLIIALLVFITIRYKINWLIPVNFLTSLGTGIFLGKQAKRVKELFYGSGYSYYEMKVELLRGILMNHGLYTKDRVQLLIELCKEEMPNLKSSEILLKPFSAITSLVFVPVLVLMLDWMLSMVDSLKEGILVGGSILSVIIAVFGLICLVKPAIEDFLDSDYLHMQKFKNMMLDIFLLDFHE